MLALVVGGDGGVVGGGVSGSGLVGLGYSNVLG